MTPLIEVRGVRRSSRSPVAKLKDDERHPRLDNGEIGEEDLTMKRMSTATWLTTLGQGITAAALAFSFAPQARAACNGGAPVTSALTISSSCDGGGSTPLSLATGAAVTINTGITVSNNAGSGRNGDPLNVASSSTSASLVNHGLIFTGSQFGVTVNGQLTSLLNFGTIQSGVRRAVVVNGGAGIGSITNTGSLIGPFADITNSGSIGTVNNLQGAGNSNGPLTFTGVAPTNYKIVVNSPTTYGRLSGSGLTGLMTFGVYGGGVSGVSASVLTAGSYAAVLSGVLEANLNNVVSDQITGSYGVLLWTLGLESGSNNIWDLVVSSPASVPAATGISGAGTIYLASNLGGSVTPTFNGGTLRVDQTNGTYVQNFSLGSSSSNTIDQNGNRSTFSGVFSDAASSGGISITNSGSGGSVTFTGASTYTGATTINNGATLALAGSGGISGSSGVVVQGTFDIAATPSGTRIVSLSGDGSVVLGSRTLTLTNASQTFGGTISGTGGLTLSGGTATLSGNNTFTGTTFVSGGSTLWLDNGLLASPVRVDGTFGGVGSVGGTVTVSGGGRLAVGATPGQLTVNAPVTLLAGSSISFDIDGPTAGNGAGHYSQLVITGVGNNLVANGTLIPVLRGITGSANNSFTPAIGQQLQIVTAQGGVLGGFSSLTQPASGLLPGTRFDVVFAPQALTLVATPIAYGNLALAGLTETADEAAVGRILDAVRPNAGARISNGLSGLFDNLYALPGPAIAQALNQLFPAIYGDGLLAARQTWYAISETVTDQIAARRDGRKSGDTVEGPKGSTIWMTGIGQFTDVTGNGTQGYHSSMGGMATGIDLPVTPDMMIGASVAGASTATTSNGATNDGTSVQFTLYGGFQSGALFLDGQASYAHVDQDVRRMIGVSGSAAKSNGGIDGGGGQIEAGFRLPYGRWQIEPAVGLSVLHLASGGVTESIGGSVAERIGGQAITSVQSLVGMRVGTEFAVTSTVPLSVHATVGWKHEYADVQTHTTANFVFAPGNPFGVSTAPISRDAARLSVGFDFKVSSAVSVFGSYQADIGGTSTSQNLTGGVRVIW
jgi:outer membrane autotransporter protein